MDERIDLTGLELDHAEQELLIASILVRASVELERRANADVSPLFVLSAWARPALAAAAVITLLCLSVLAGHEFGKTTPRPWGVAEALNVPAPAQEWLAADRPPTVEDLILAMEENR